MLKMCLTYSKVAIPLLLGICIGIALSFIILPFIEERTCKIDSFYSASLNRHTKSIRNNGNRLASGVDFDSFLGAEFEPQVIKSELSGAQSVKKPVRRKFVNLEVDIKEPVFIGYLSSLDQWNNRLVALNKTLVSSTTNGLLPVKFFINVGQKSPAPPTSVSSSSMVALKLLDTSTLPLVTLKHMVNLHIKRYKYFTLLPDNVYVKRSMSDHISLSIDENPCFCFSSTKESACDMSSGLVISNRVLIRLSENVERCEQLFKRGDNSRATSMSSSSAFEALHKCIHHITEVSCTALPNSQYDYEEGESSSLETAMRSSHTMIISSIKSATDIYTVRRLEAILEMEKTKIQIDSIRGGMEHLLADIGAPAPWPAAVSEKYHTSNRYDVARWTLITGNSSYLEYDLRNSLPLTDDQRRDIDDMMKVIIADANKKSERYRPEKLIQAYRRADPTRGLDYIITLALQDKLSGLTENRTYELVKPLTSFALRHLHRTSTDTTHVNVVVPIYDAEAPHDIDELVRKFIQTFRANRYTTLTPVLVYSAKEYHNYQMKQYDIFQQTKQRIGQMQTENMVMLKEVHGDVMSMASLIRQISSSFSPNSIISLSSLTTQTGISYMSRVRRNVIQGRQAYAPVAFYQYSPKFLPSTVHSDKIEVARGAGHFASNWYGHLSFHVRDLPPAGMLTGGGALEDLLVRCGLELLRSPDPDCTVRYKEWSCEERSLDLSVCRERNLDHIASSSMLAANLLKEGQLRIPTEDFY